MDTLDQVLETIGPSLGPLVVIEILVDDDIEECQGQGAVSARADLKPDLGLGGQPGQSRVDNDELRAHAHEVDEPVTHEAVGVGCQRLVCPDDDDLRLGPLSVLIAVRMQLCVVKDPAVAFLQEVGGHARLVAGVGREEAEGHVRGTERSAEDHSALPHCVTTGTGKRNNAFGPDAAELVPDNLAAVVEGFLDEIESLIPGDALPLVGALLAIEKQRPLQAVMVVDLLNHVDAAQAQTTLAVREVGVALNPRQLAVNSVGENTTTVVATRTRPDRGAGDFMSIFKPTPICLIQIFVVFIDCHEIPPFL